MQAKFTKASLDAQRYKYENALATAPRSASSQKRGLDELEREFEGRRLRLARLQQAETSAKAARESLVARREDVQTEFEKLTSDYRTSLKRLAGLIRTQKRDYGFTLPSTLRAWSLSASSLIALYRQAP